MFDTIIIGSGAAGVMAARALKGKNVLMLDVGIRPGESLTGPIGPNLYAARHREPDLFPLLIGDGFESLHNLHRTPMSIKLKSPGMRYVVEGADTLSPVRSRNFEATMSFAAGGLANAWGAGVYRFNDRDLEGYPITPEELAPFYDDLTQHLGISGVNDDLSASFGTDEALQSPLPLSRMAADLLDGYTAKHSRFAEQGIAIGRVRHAALTRPHRGRPPYEAGNFEFFRANDPAVYNPAYTLQELIDDGSIAYREGYLALRYQETQTGLEVTARHLGTGAAEVFTAHSLILAAGALNSAKLALGSAEDFETRLPVLDNPMACLPFFQLKRFGQKLDRLDSSLGQLTVIQEFEGATLQGTIFGTAGPLRSDILFDLPFSIAANATIVKQTAAATGMLMMFYPATANPANYLRLTREGVLEIEYGAPEAGCPPRGLAERTFSRLLRKIGFHTLPGLCRYPPPGSAIHYAGTLPLSATPDAFQTHPDGRLSGTRAVYVADGACFPRLPAKNLTFTIMANAMRIATLLRDRLT